MKLGILGTGFIAKELMSLLDQLDIEKAYVLGTEKTREETEALKAQYGLAGAFYDYDDLLNSDVDTVYVGLPNFLHYSFSKQALLAGKHVIVEKPGASNAKEMKELADIAEEKQLILVEAMSIHYMPAVLKIKEKLSELGDLKIVSLNYSQYSRRYDSFKKGEILPVFDPKKAGGALMDINVYNVHFVMSLFGKPESVSYQANVERGIDTSGVLTLKYPAFQAVCIGAKDCKAPLMNTLQGDEGCIVINSPVNGMTSFELDYNDGRSESYTSENPETNRMIYEFREFIRMIDEKDYETAEKMLDLSVAVSEVMTEARLQAGIVFPADE